MIGNGIGGGGGREMTCSKGPQVRLEPDETATAYGALLRQVSHRGTSVVMFWTEKRLMPQQQQQFWSCSQYKTALCSTFKQGLYIIIVAFYT